MMQELREMLHEDLKKVRLEYRKKIQELKDKGDTENIDKTVEFYEEIIYSIKCEIERRKLEDV